MGHATRCVPIIYALINSGFEPILASDGNALLVLQKEFPTLKSYTLPSYNIKYTKSGKNLKFKLLLSVPFIYAAVKKEQQFVTNLIASEGICGVISDNRFGLFNAKIPTVYITHQLQVLSGATSFLTSKIHQKVISKYTQCWVPDFEGNSNYSGILTHLKTDFPNIKYVGVLSRLKQFKTAIKYDLLVLLSGPEPQRTILEKKLLFELKSYKGAVLFVQGVPNTSTSVNFNKNIEIVDYLETEVLEKAINQSRLVLARSGYSTIMDLAVLGKKAFFIPTPGQFEQVYLAESLQEKRIAPFSEQANFKLANLNEVENYTGFTSCKTAIDLNLFSLF
ncbi:glycosyltransferase [Lutibacter sp. HS1-25]|uniref:glycosyltransferase n=1 Tax=Lutibacter sp. HS1-25 TaxID=2485000 RepID=UPI001F0C0941|nr:glycosyltransferase [Lutibacter sp. HS1-25]